MRILVYYPYNLPTIEVESVTSMLQRAGNEVNFYTSCARGPLHERVESMGIKAHHSNTPAEDDRIQLIPEHALNLYRLCRKQRIQLVIAHQQKPALVAGLVRLLCGFKLVYVRHNSDEDYLLNPRKARLLNWMVNIVTPHKIAPSSAVLSQWVNKEGVSSRQISRVDYGYDFNRYQKPDPAVVDQLRREFETPMLLLCLARLTPPKRHLQLFQMAKQLKALGIGFKLLCVGSGQLHDLLQQNIRENALEQHVFLVGQRSNVMDYHQACDVFVHFSETEASNSAVKEAGLCRKPVLVCREVGDFEDYIEDGETGFLLPKQDPIPRAVELLYGMATGTIRSDQVGDNLHRRIFEKFDIGVVAKSYRNLLENLAEPMRGRF